MARNLQDLFYGGVGYEEIVGANAAPGLQYQGPPRMPSQMRSAYPAQGVVNNPPTKLRRTSLGVDSVATVAAAATVIITLTPQVIFRSERFIVGGAIADSFLINDIKVGNVSMFPSADAVPASVYIASATDAQLAFKTCQIGQKITVTVTNISAGALRFIAAFNGSTAE